MGDWIGSIFWLLVTLGVLVTFHELGHFWVARRFGVKVLRFSVGFGTPFWSRYDKHGAEIAVAPIPLGGYVKMLDERDCHVAPEDADKTYNSKKIWQRALILLAGPGFNFILAFLLYWLMFVVGKNEVYPTLGEPQKLMQSAGFQKGDRLISIDDEDIRSWSDVSLALITSGIDRQDVPVIVETANGSQQLRTLPLSQLADDVDEEDIISAVGLSVWRPDRPAIVGEVTAGLPADLAGVQGNDRIISVNSELVQDWYDVVTVLSQAGEEAIELVVERSSEQLTLSIPQRVMDEETGERKIIGVVAMELAPQEQAFAERMFYVLSYGPFQAINKASAETWKMTSVSLEMMGKLVTGKASIKNISGPVTIAQVANDSAKRGLSWFLSFLALVSLSLGIINLMPVPMLDGGQLLFLMFEKFKGAPLSENFQLKAHFVGLIMIVSLMSLAFYNDILRTVS
ncbi:RIP metalloprotease RseP [Marinicella sp. W31]|uniref:RIP metalloprotease RseP n=1 Tax=Marinicella sp. W31 TaxID=3023713 RepID=UPI00375828D3